MGLEKIIWLRCDSIGKGMFDCERTAYIAGKPYIVNCCNLIFDRQREIFYVKVIRVLAQGKGRLLAGINANDGYENIEVEEKDLVRS